MSTPEAFTGSVRIVPRASGENPEPLSATPRSRRRFSWFNVEGCVAVVALLAAWEIAAGHLPAFLFPSLGTIWETLLGTLSSVEALGSIALTYVRIVVSLVLVFIFASLVGVWAAKRERVDRAVMPLIQIKQGIPGVCWAIFAIIWFENMELRIGFVIIISIFPSFFFMIRDGYRNIPRDLWEMVHSWRPSRWQMARKLIFPALLPAVLTSWRLNLGNGARVAVTAELLAGISGIGHELRTAQEQFRMDTALAWTVVLAVFILVSDYGMARLERRLLGWRQQPTGSV